jgi:hypothetical protein
VWGELLAVLALALTGPAAVVVATGGALGAAALAVWAGCVLFFAGGVFHVKMLLASAKFRHGLTTAQRWSVGRGHLVFHALLALVVTAGAAAAGGAAAGALLVAAFLPALARAFHGWATLDGTLPPLKRVGIRETILAVWFVGFGAAALRLLA